MRNPTDKQLYTLSQLIKEIEPTMVVPKNMSREMASARIAWLLKKKANPAITKKQYMQ